MTIRETPEHRVLNAIRTNSVDILGYFTRRVGQDRAADLVAETMMTAWRRGGSLSVFDDQARMWLFGIARNVLANAERTERRRLRLANRLRLLTGSSGDAPDLDAGSEVCDAVSRLPSDQAEVIRLVHWDGFTLAEVSELLQQPATTTRSRFLRAEESLREALAPHLVRRI
ncbi:RNA polymerase sigma-70 factor (ECF subfamily) [Salinibacterium sp. CAN_S4]|uniref:RNA polymerase sigma factor n=1 Tax=Salinibacterium sp. CAN_S4 TaxID=2787727 RepID=UPI001A344E63